MKDIEKYLRLPLTLFEIGDVLAALPSPRKRFFHHIISVSGLSPNTVKMILCYSDAGIYPSIYVQRKIAKALKGDISTLFPEKRTQENSIADIYQKLSSKRTEYEQFLILLSTATDTHIKTVKKWLSKRSVPKAYNQRRIARVIGVSIHKLFPIKEVTL